MSLGASRVRVKFNPSGETEVDRIKERTAKLIDICHAHTEDATPEAKRLWLLAMTAYEEAAMWAVKAATGP